MVSAPSTPTPTLLRPPSYHPDWGAPGQPQYVVINPMHVVTLQDRTKTFAVRCVEKIKAISEKWFTHVLLLLFLMAYTCIGALIFQWIEGPLEHREKFSIQHMRDLIIKDLWEARQRASSISTWEHLAHRRMKEYEEQIYTAYSSGITTDSEKPVWTFWGAMFYCGTVFTTIGYGNIYPNTTAGQAATIIYAFIGIPFLLMVLADLGKLFTRAFKMIFVCIRQFYHTGKFQKVRRVGRRATAVPVQYMTIAWNRMPYAIKRRASADITRVDDKNAELVNNNVTKAKDVEANDVKTKEKQKKEENQEEAMTFAQPSLEYDADEEFNLPVSLVVFMLMLYLMLGAFIFTLWEEWTFFESFYFVFVSMSTIGFGDYVPDHPMYMMAAFIYLLFGLALTSMCINVVQEKLSATFEKAKLRIGTTIGFDPSVFMEEETVTDETDSDNDPEGKKSATKSRRGSKVSKEKSSDDEKKKKSEKGDLKAIEEEEGKDT